MTPPESPESAIAQLRGEYQALIARLEANQGAFRHLARSVYRVQEDERRRLARDLHDGIGQNLTALKHQLALLAADLATAAPAYSQRLQASIDLCSQTLSETREMSRLLRPQVLDDLGLAAALSWLARTVGDSGGLAIEAVVTELPDLDGEVQTLLFRVAQEALGNVLRHAQAQHALLRLDCRGGWLQLTIWDDGRGFEPDHAAAAASQGRSAGLSGLRERLGLFGGELSIKSQPEGGTRLLALVPWPGPTGTLSP